jgi:hypothetical protein
MGYRSARLVALVITTSYLAGCSFFAPRTSEPPANLGPLTGNQAYVFVDGRYKTVTPAEVTIRRDFAEALVTLRVGKRTVRTFEVERTNTSNRSTLEYSFSGSSQSGYLTFDLAELPVVKDTIHVVPYYERPIQVQDRRYGLTLLVH